MTLTILKKKLKRCPKSMSSLKKKKKKRRKRTLTMLNWQPCLADLMITSVLLRNKLLKL